MQWPWNRKPQPDVNAIAQQAATLAAEKATAELSRLLQPAGYGLPDPTAAPAGLPYRWNNPWLYTVPQAPTKPPQSPVTTETLRNLGNYCDQLRAVILHIIREVSAVPISVVPRNAKDKSDATKARCFEAQEWLDTEDGGMGGIGSRRAHFESQSIDDLSVIGAAATFFQYNRRGELNQVYAIDAATIRPRVDIYGWADEIAWEQWVYGVQNNGYTRRQMSYDGLYALSYSPFFMSPTEYLVNVVDTVLASDQWNKLWLTEGTGSNEIYALPESWTPEQVMNWAEYWAQLKKGNTGARQRTSWVPSGTAKLGDHSRKDQDFQEFDLWLLRRICSIFGVQPASVGYVGEQYKVSQDKSMGATTQFGIVSILEWRRNLYNNVLKRLGYDDLHVQDVSGEEESEEARADRLVSLVGGGIKTPNEARSVEGDDPIEGGDTLLVPSTLQPLEHALIPPPDPMELAAAKSAKPDDGPPKGGDTQRVEAVESEEIARMLGQWERLTLKRLEQGKQHAVAFAGLPDDLATSIYLRLQHARTADEVRAVFAQRGAHDPNLQQPTV